MQLGIFAERVETNPSVAVGLLKDAGQEVIVAIDELRELAHGIHPSELRDLGLARAVQSIALRSTLPVQVVALPGRAARAGRRGRRVLPHRRGPHQRA